ncbi:MAG: hypothetical protein DRJ35_08175 [Thermoprotei archaeon]|nr:MAG: hypothetical protein DRJ35_08175 [Thermoprotei archaeon]
MSDIEELRRKLEKISKELEEIKRKIDQRRVNIGAISSLDEITETLATTIDDKEEGGVFMHAGVIKKKGKIIDYWSHTFTDEDVYSIDPKSIVELIAPLTSEQRINILRTLLKHRQTNMTQISKETGLEGGELYHHLKELLRRGFIKTIRRGVYTITMKGEISLIIVSGLASWLEPQYSEEL